jgi:hypothetical protein
MTITQAIREAVAEERGTDIDDDEILASWKEHEGTTLEEAQEEKDELWERFEDAGGRGFDLANKIDSLNNYLGILKGQNA